MNKKDLFTALGVLGYIFAILGIVFLTLTLTRNERNTFIENGIETDAEIISIQEDRCSTGRYSSLCYDTDVMFYASGELILTTVKDERYIADKYSVDDTLPIIYNAQNPYEAIYNYFVEYSFLSRASIYWYAFLPIGIIFIILGFVCSKKYKP